MKVKDNETLYMKFCPLRRIKNDFTNEIAFKMGPER
jgi:hypothetical protein